MAVQSTQEADNQIADTSSESAQDGANVQAETDSNADASATVEAQAEQSGENQKNAPEGRQDFVGQVPKELEPFKKNILNKYFSKTRELAEERRGVEQVRKDAETLQHLMAYKPFQDWYNAQKTGTTASDKPSLSEEELEAIRTDPSKFDAFLSKKLESLMESKYGRQIESFREKAEDIEVAKEYEAAEKAYGEEFAVAHNSGELNAYYDKGYDYKAAYGAWKLDNGKFVSNGELDKVTGEKAVQMINKSRNASTEKPSSGGGKLPMIKIIPKNKSFGDTFDAAFEAVLKGEKIRVEKGG